MNLIEALYEQAEMRPEAAALIDRHRGRRRVLTFAALKDRADRAAAMLQASGLRPGEAVLLLQPMSAELYVALAALFKLGLTAVVLDPAAGRAHVAACCSMHPIRGFIGGTKAHLLRLLVPDVRRIPHRFVVGGPLPGAVRWSKAGGFEPLRGFATTTAGTPALLTFTSGSTGAPKGAIRTHGLLMAQYEALRRSLDLQPGQVDLATLPIFVLANLAAGVTSVIPAVDLRRPGRVPPAPLLDQIRTEGVTRIGASPAFFERLLTPEAPDAFRNLTHLYTGGAPVFSDLLERLQQAAPQSRVVALYGSTEAEPIAHAGWEAEVARCWAAGEGLLAGRPVREVELRILEDRWGTPIGPFSRASFEAMCRPAGERGEIVVRGDHVLPGYLAGKGDEETKFDVAGTRWHRTGDAGYLDEQGQLWLLGRCAAKVEQAGAVLYPLAVESKVRTRAAVGQVAFVEHRGRRLLVVEPRPDTLPDPIALRRALGEVAVDEVRVVARLPVDRRHNAKVDYGRLHRLLERQLG